jgi:ribosomal protein S18 acetylase RimI-like enzyme
MINQRSYSGEHDQVQMIRLALEHQADTMHAIDLPYRLSSWALDDPENVALWVDDGDQLLAWAVMQTPFWSADYVIHPAVERLLHPQLLGWINQRARALLGTIYARPCWFVNVFANQALRRQELEAAGFANQAAADEDAWSKVWMLRRQAAVPEYPAPSGFTLRSLAGEREAAAYAALHQQVFESKNMTTQWRLRTLKHPGYRRELDTVVAAPGGRLAAFCVGWMAESPANGLVGQVEPLGCHAHFRRYALGRVALCETLRRLQRLGVNNVYVETDSYRNTAFRLYESLGFQVAREVRVYRKDYSSVNR